MYVCPGPVLVKSSLLHCRSGQKHRLRAVVCWSAMKPPYPAPNSTAPEPNSAISTSAETSLSFSTFPIYVCVPSLSSGFRIKWHCKKDLFSHRLPAAVGQPPPVISLQLFLLVQHPIRKTVLFGVFPMFVPSLSW